nr:LOW QUALITY PROTEIN: uncharacterized protein LOC121124754 [Lepeophtheirus salmonis]
MMMMLLGSNRRKASTSHLSLIVIVLGLTFVDNVIGRTAFEKLTDLSYAGETYYTIRNLSLYECQGWCREEPECQAASFSFQVLKNPLRQDTVCLLQNGTQANNPTANPSSKLNSYYMVKMSIRSDKVCKRPWNFERVPNKMISGHDKALIFTSTKEACLAACLNERNFICRSAEYNYVTLQCRLSDHDRRTVRKDYAPVDFVDAQGVDYFENLCLSASDACLNSVRNYQIPKIGIPDQKISLHVGVQFYVDKELMANSIQACDRACNIEAEFLCRSYLYLGAPSGNDYNCKLFHLDHWTLPDYEASFTKSNINPANIPNGGRIGSYYENRCGHGMKMPKSLDFGDEKDESNQEDDTMLCKRVVTKDRRYITQITCYEKGKGGSLRRKALSLPGVDPFASLFRVSKESLGDTNSGSSSSSSDTLSSGGLPSNSGLSSSSSNNNNNGVTSSFTTSNNNVNNGGSAFSGGSSGLFTGKPDGLGSSNNNIGGSSSFGPPSTSNNGGNVFSGGNGGGGNVFIGGSNSDDKFGGSSINGGSFNGNGVNKYPPSSNNNGNGNSNNNGFSNGNTNLNSNNLSGGASNGFSTSSGGNNGNYNPPSNINEIDKDVNCDFLGTCYDVTVHCKDTRIVVNVGTNRPFSGRIYALGRSETCNVDVINSNAFRLDLTMSGQDCNTQSVNGVYTNTVVVQRHSVVMTKTDKIYKVRCTYDTSSKNITFGMMPIRDPDMISITSAPEAPAPRISILDKKGKEVETVRIGDKLRFKIEIPDKTPYGIFARSCVAMAKDSRSTFPIIDENGCPFEPTIFPRFTPDSNALISEYEAFRFTESYGVIFQCNVKYCLGPCEPASCIFGREGFESWGRKRRRRAIGNEDINDEEPQMRLSHEIIVLDYGDEQTDTKEFDKVKNSQETPMTTISNDTVFHANPVDWNRHQSSPSEDVFLSSNFEDCPTRSSVLALIVTCTLLVVLYICTICFYCVKRSLKKSLKSPTCHRDYMR